MDKNEAGSVLRSQIEEFRRLSYIELKKLIGREPIRRETTGPSGTWYQLEIEVFWDDKENGNIRVVGGIDDGGWRAFVPLTYSFIMTPDGIFLDEESA